LKEVQVEIERSEVRMPDGPIHELGEFEVGVHLHSEINATIKLRVVAAE
jgi:large subunit ribosomal protein L9